MGLDSQRAHSHRKRRAEALRESLNLPHALLHSIAMLVLSLRRKLRRTLVEGSLEMWRKTLNVVKEKG